MMILLFFIRPLEWSIESGRNICFVSYPKTKMLINAAKYMVDEHVLEFIAKMIGDFILAISSFKWHDLHDMSHVEMVGFSFGAHIAAFACRYLHKQAKTQVKFLLGINGKTIFQFQF